jgi:hypothetical protein
MNVPGGKNDGRMQPTHERQRVTSTPLGPTIVQTAMHVSIHIALWLAVLAVMIFWVPRFQGPLADLKFKVPQATVFIFDISNLVLDSWFLFGPLIVILLLCVDGPIYFFLRRRYPNMSWLWSALMILLPLAVVSIIFIALSLPGVKALEGNLQVTGRRLHRDIPAQDQARSTSRIVRSAFARTSSTSRLMMMATCGYGRKGVSRAKTGCQTKLALRLP